MSTVTSIQKQSWPMCQAIATDLMGRIDREQTWYQRNSRLRYSVYNHTQASAGTLLDVWRGSTLLFQWNPGAGGTRAVASFTINSLFNAPGILNNAWITVGASTYPFGLLIPFSGATVNDRITSFAAALALIIPTAGWSAAVTYDDLLGNWTLTVTTPVGEANNGIAVSCAVATGSGSSSTGGFFNYAGTDDTQLTLAAQLAALRTGLATSLGIPIASILTINNQLWIPGEYDNIVFYGGFTTLGTAIPAVTAIPNLNYISLEKWRALAECTEIVTEGPSNPYPVMCTGTAATATPVPEVVTAPTNNRVITGLNWRLLTIPAGKLITNMVCLGTPPGDISVGTAVDTLTNIVPTWDVAYANSVTLSYYCAVETTLYIGGLTEPTEFIIIYQ